MSKVKKKLEYAKKNDVILDYIKSKDENFYKQLKVVGFRPNEDFNHLFMLIGLLPGEGYTMEIIVEPPKGRTVVDLYNEDSEDGDFMSEDDFLLDAVYSSLYKLFKHLNKKNGNK